MRKSNFRSRISGRYLERQPLKYAKYIGKIDKVLRIRIKTIYNFRAPWDKLSTKVSPFFYETLGSFNFFQVI